MGRIRTIKPEFPQSESMGRISRDARLMFVMLWTSADDEGRGRGASRMLASTLFPFDDDAKDLVEDWLSELERENCIARYSVDGSAYFQIVNWSSHQKIDKPTPSRFPAPSGLISENRSERDVELTLYDALERSRTFCSRKIIAVQRQVRVGSRYLDIVAKTEDQTFVLEIKKNNITNADLEQVLSYCALVSGIPILVGPGISAQFDTVNAANAGAAIVTFDSDLTFSVTLASEHIKAGDNVLGNVRERSRASTVGSRTKEGTKEGTKDKARTIVRDASLPDWLPLDAWEAFVAMRKKIGKPITDYAVKLAIEKLGKMRAKGHDIREILDYSILNNYQGLFEPRGDKPANSKGISAHDRGTRGAAMWLAGQADDGDGTGTSGGPLPANGHGRAQVGVSVRRILDRLPAPDGGTIPIDVQGIPGKS